MLGSFFRGARGRHGSYLSFYVPFCVRRNVFVFIGSF